MAESEFTCQCCWRSVARGKLGGYVGVGSVAPLCLSCYRVYGSVGTAYPDRTLSERLDTARVVCALDALSPAEREKLKKLIFLVRNHSPRAQRLSRMALDGEISFSQLLSII